MSIKVTCLINSDQMGGAELSTIELLETLSSDIDYYIISPLKPPNGLRKKFIFLGLKRFYFTWNVISIFSLLFSIVKDSINIINIIRKNEGDLIYVHSIQSFFYSIIPKLILRRKIIWHIRDHPPSSLIYKMAYLFSDCSLCISQFIYDTFPENGNKKKLLLNAIDIDKWQKQLSFKIHEELGLYNKTKIVANVGQLVPWKNQLVFIEVANEIAKKFTGVHFVIIGADLFGENSNYVKKLFHEIKYRKLEKKISFLGHKSDIKKYLNSIDILVHTANEEPFGRVIVETMALEKPVIAMDSGGPKEIVINDKTGYLIEKKSPVISIVNKIVLLLKDENLSATMGIAGRHHVNENFHIKKRKNEVERLFHETLQEKDIN